MSLLLPDECGKTKDSFEIVGSCHNNIMKKNQFVSIVWKEGRHFVAQCLNLDVSSFGKTKKEAIKNLEEALELYFEDQPLRLPKVESPSIEVRQLQRA